MIMMDKLKSENFQRKSVELDMLLKKCLNKNTMQYISVKVKQAGRPFLKKPLQRRNMSVVIKKKKFEDSLDLIHKNFN